MTISQLKTCPRCGGNIFLTREMDGYYEECLQCSYSHEVSGITVKMAEKSRFYPSLDNLQYSQSRHEPNIVDDFENEDNMEPRQNWLHPPIEILKKLREIGARLLYFSSENRETPHKGQ